MSKYRVYIYEGLFEPRLFTFSPHRSVDVEIDGEQTENEIIKEALKKLGSYPRSYTARVVEL